MASYKQHFEGEKRSDSDLQSGYEVGWGMEEVKVPGDTSRNLRVGIVRLNPRERVGEHSTGDKEEVLLVVGGEAHLLSKDS